MRGMSRIYLSYDPEQQLLLPPDLREWLPEGHLALPSSWGNGISIANWQQTDIWPSPDVGDEFRTEVVNQIPAVFLSTTAHVLTEIGYIEQQPILH